MIPSREFLLEHLDVLRAALFLCCAGYFWILYAWVRPDGSAVRRAALASVTQFWVGLSLDIFIVRSEAWTYREMPFAIGGVPIDLHLDWSLLWGFGLCWLSDRILGPRTSAGRIALYIVTWTLLTLAFDVMMADWMLFIDTVSPHWWLIDIAFLATVQTATLWLYRSIGKQRGESTGLANWTAVPPYARSILYLSFALAFFFVYLPDAAMSAAAHFGYASQPAPVPYAPVLVVALAFAFGGWATHEFALRGRGTPIPWDPPHYLVTSGPYALLRNPMQVSGILLTVAVFLHRPGWPLLVYLLDVVVMVTLVFHFFEPAPLQARFGAVHERYRSTVRNWIPRIRPLPQPSAERPVLFFDGDCGLCQASLRTLIRFDTQKALRFAPLSGTTARGALTDDLQRLGDKTLILWEPETQAGGPDCFSTRSAAVLRALGTGTPIPVCFAAALVGVPGAMPVSGVVYRGISAIRKRVFRADPGFCELYRTDERFLD